MLNRRGFTLIELLVVVVLLGIVGLATSRIMRAMLITNSAQVQVASSLGEARTANLFVPLELREIGYDTIPLAGQATTDLLAIANNRLTFRAMRGLGITCGTPTLTEFRVRKPILGQRDPLLTDGVLLFLESDPNYGLDDQWVAMAVTSIDLNSTCGADSAIAFTLSATPIVNPAVSTPMAISQHFVGGPVRWFERIEYGPVTDATTSEVFLGARSLSLSQATLSPVAGPLPDTTGFALVYYNSAGAVLNPATANRLDVRSIGVTITTVAPAPVSLAGSTKRARRTYPLTTRVALRNTLRP